MYNCFNLLHTEITETGWNKLLRVLFFFCCIITLNMTSLFISVARPNINFHKIKTHVYIFLKFPAIWRNFECRLLDYAETLAALRKVAAGVGIKVIVSKTKYMVAAWKTHLLSLGSLVNIDNNVQEEVRRRLGSTALSTEHVWDHWWPTVRIRSPWWFMNCSLSLCRSSYHCGRAGYTPEVIVTVGVGACG